VFAAFCRALLVLSSEKLIKAPTFERGNVNIQTGFLTGKHFKSEKNNFVIKHTKWKK